MVKMMGCSILLHVSEDPNSSITNIKSIFRQIRSVFDINTLNITYLNNKKEDTTEIY